MRRSLLEGRPGERSGAFERLAIVGRTPAVVVDVNDVLLVGQGPGDISIGDGAGGEPDAQELTELRTKVEASYEEQTDIRYAAARLWVDRIIEPEETRTALLRALSVALRHDEGRPFRTGVLQV